MDSLLWNRFPCFATSQKPEILCALPSLSSRKTRHFYNPAFIVRANKRFSARRFSVRRPTAAFRSGYCRVWLDCHVAQTCRNTHVPHRGCRTFWRELSSRLACQDIPIRQSVQGVLPSQEMNGRSRLSSERRVDPSNLSDHHQIGRRFHSHGEKSRSL